MPLLRRYIPRLADMFNCLYLATPRLTVISFQDCALYYSVSMSGMTTADTLDKALRKITERARMGRHQQQHGVSGNVFNPTPSRTDFEM